MSRTASLPALSHRVVATPAMCGPGPLFFGQAGDWTWQAVGAACSLNTFRARTPDGRPSYLAFSYFRVRASALVHPYGIAFGDEFDLESRVYQAGSQSVVTLHRLAPPDSDLSALHPGEFHVRPREDCIYIETFNRWVSRSATGTNHKLLSRVPTGFQDAGLPTLPARHSPRNDCGHARHHGTFHPGGITDHRLAVTGFQTSYTVDAARDLNGADLLYFASYFAIIDTALLRLWHELGRSDHDFLRRHLLDHRIGYFSNADPGDRLKLDVRLWRHETSQQETADVSLTDAATGHLMAVSSVRLLPPPT
ncbi:LnmK family bifunctional acyltransferase/decarboxylase [Streptomyces sp. TRM 70351]|uniref:LnmK family bifunctional acyltransferase/decarboxylase n=1 Tax=Streptomyces sp. TRM 70351 TaxID=3116552 RepID=UPI002E7B0E44|nr:LnmK family bifunctional acyltransferase/decarboxylase [Streptomyces sp. TRM 70351]MEE1928863.1 LnmK family bifunctional acyltransferase/decarboxylase [Streptomyces sp. TRM 70351]